MKKYIHTNLFIGALCLFGLAASFLIGATEVLAAGATLSVSPSSLTVTSGQTFTSTIMLDTHGVAIDGVDVYSLHFNPGLLQIVDEGSVAGVQITPGTLLPLTIINVGDNSNGTVQFSQVNAGGSTYTGAGTLASITFKAIASGTTAVTIDFSGNGNDSNVAGGGIEQLTSVDNASYKISSPSSSSSGGGGSRSSGGGGGSSTPTSSTPATTTVGCTGTSIFSSVNGMRCAPTTSVGCGPGALYSTVTGARCATTATPSSGTTGGSTYVPPVSSSSYVITKTLFITMRDPQVATLQKILIKLGYNIGGTPTGYFGALTDAAVKNFQRTHGIAYSGTLSTTGYGLVGPKTKNALLSAVAGL